MKSLPLTIRPALAIFGSWILLFALILVNGYALNLLGLAANAWVVAILVLLELLLFVRVLAHRQLDWAGDPLDLAGFLVVVVGVWLYFVYPAWPALLPPTASGDAVNLHSFTDHIFRTGQIFADYPGGPSLITATLAHWAGLSPLRFEHPMAALWIALMAGGVYGIACAMMPDRRAFKTIALVAPAALFIPWYYFAGTLLRYQYFSTQIAGQLFLIGFVWFLVEYRATRRLFWTLGMAACVIGISVSYQLWLALPLALFVLLFLADILTGLRSKREVVIGSVRSVLVVVGPPALFWAAILIAGDRFVPQLSRFQSIGAVSMPSLETFGGTFLVIPALGLLLSFRSHYRTGTVMACSILVGLQVAAFLGAHLWLNLAEYWVGKAFFLLIFPIALFAVIPVAQAYELVQDRFIGLHPVWAWGLVVIVLGGLVWIVFPPPVYSPLGESEIQVAEWARDHLPSRHIDYIGRKSLTAQWLGEGMWGERYPDDLFVDLAALGPKTYEEWRNDPDWGEYLFVSAEQHLPLDGALQTVYQFGDTAMVRRPSSAPPAVEQATRGSFGDVFGLDDYQAPRQTFRAGESISTTIRVATFRMPLHQVVWRVQLRDSQGNAVVETRVDPFGNKFPLHRWPDGILLSQALTLSLPLDLAPGVYNLHLGLYYVGSGEPVGYRSADGVTDDSVLLGRIKVALSPPEKQELDQMTRTDSRFGDALALLGYRLHDDPTLVPGGSFKIDLYWQSIRPVQKDYTVFVHLIDASGRLRAQQDSAPRQGTYPTSFWEKGEIVADSYSLSLPPDLPPGDYRLAIGIYEWPSMQRLAVNDGSQRSPSDQLVLPTAVRVAAH